MVGIDDTYLAEIPLARKSPNGRKKKRDLLVSLVGQDVSVVTTNAKLFREVLHYNSSGKHSGVYVGDVKIPITAVQRVYPEQKEIKLYEGILV